MAMSGGTAKLVKTGALGGTSNTCKLYVYYKTSQDVTNNKSTISVGMYIVISSGWNIGSWTDTSGSYVGTTALTFDGSIPNVSGTYWLVENKTFTVNHNTDGTGTATIAWKWGVNSSWGGMVTPSGSFTITLPTIPRKSSVTATNAYIGNKPTITISRASSSFTHTLQYKISGESSYTTIVSKTTSTSYNSWSIPESAYNYISDGKVTVTIKCITYSGSTKIGEATTTLTATAKGASSIKATSAYVGKASTLTITRNSSNFKHTLQYKISGQSSYTTIVSKTTSTSYSWTIPTAAYDLIGSTGKSVSVTINCITYYGDVNLGSKTTTLTASCLESACKPTLAPTVKDTGSTSIKLTGDANNIVIKDYNVMTYTIGATAKNGATIKSQKITCGGKSNTAASGKLSYVNSNVFTITATDSRGFSNSTTVTKKTLINYVRLTCEPNISAKLATDDSGNSTATLTIGVSGKWFNGSFGAVTNTLTVQYRYKTNSGDYGSWTSITATKSGNTYTATKTITGLGYKNSYTVEVRAYDALYSNGDSIGYGMITPAAKTVKAQPLFDWGENDFTFHIPVKLPSGEWVDNDSYGLDLNNSDIIDVNSIYFADASNSNVEGILFKRDDGNWDSLRVYNGQLILVQGYPDGSYNHKLLYCVGDSISFTGGVGFAGHITNGSTELYLTIPINKPMLVNGVESITGSIVCRGVQGYMYSAADTSSNALNLSSPNGFSISSIQVRSTCLVLKLVFDSKVVNSNGSAYTNNTPFTATNSGTLTIKFK